MARELEGKVAAVTGGASGIGLASAEAMLAAGARVVLVDRDEAAVRTFCEKHGDAAIPLVIDLLDSKRCAALMPQILERAGRLDIFHANAGLYIGGDLIDAEIRTEQLGGSIAQRPAHQPPGGQLRFTARCFSDLINCLPPLRIISSIITQVN